MPNPVFEFQNLSKSPDETARFYTQLFEWSVDTNNPLKYHRIDTRSTEGIQEGVWQAPPQAPNFVQLFIAVDDVTKYVKKAAWLGASVIVPPTPLPSGEEMAVLLDPQQMSFAVYRRAAP